MVFTIVRLVIDWIIDAYITVLFVRMILDWVSVLAPRWYPKGVVASLINVVYQLTEPPLRWLPKMHVSFGTCWCVAPNTRRQPDRCRTQSTRSDSRLSIASEMG